MQTQYLGVVVYHWSVDFIYVYMLQVCKVTRRQANSSDELFLVLCLLRMRQTCEDTKSVSVLKVKLRKSVNTAHCISHRLSF